MRIDLKLMMHAHALAEHGNFSRAAAALHLTQPALSRSILELETRVGVRLFDRTRIGATPTDAGQLFLERSRELISRAQDFEADIDLLGGRHDGELRIGSGTYPSEIFVAEAMGRTLRDYPRARMRVMVDHWVGQISMLRRREIDLAIAGLTRDPVDPDLQAMPLTHRQGYMVVRAGHPLTQERRLTLARVLTFPFLSIAQLPPPMMGALLRAAREGNVGPNDLRLPAIGCDSLSMVHTIAAGSDAVALTDLATAMPYVEAGRLAVLPLVEPALSMTFCIYRLRDQAPSAVSLALERAVREVDAEGLRRSEDYARRFIKPPTGRQR
jgi:DNA-binding transcriptional LysR family regulator